MRALGSSAREGRGQERPVPERRSRREGLYADHAVSAPEPDGEHPQPDRDDDAERAECEPAVYLVAAEYKDDPTVPAARRRRGPREDRAERSRFRVRPLLRLGRAIASRA